MNVEYKGKYLGKTIGRLFINKVYRENGAYQAEGLCDCGKPFKAFLVNVTTGKTKSCGCREHESRTPYWLKTHGQSNRKKPTSEYWAWGKMKQRCHNPSSRQYESYGGRGIFVCDSWRNSFEAFFNDMGIKPSPRHSIDRINNNDGYYKENCRWATSEIQMGNRRCVKLFPFMGGLLCLDAINRKLGFRRSTISKRMSKGWSYEKAISTPIMSSYDHSKK